MRLDINTIATVASGMIYGHHGDSVVENLIIDSRSPIFTDHNMFCALSGASDGHRYIAEMYRRGIHNFLVTRLPEGYEASMPEATFVVVKSVEDAIIAIARCWRSQLTSTTFVGITGSVGKTVIKEMIYSALSGRCKVARSPRSWNSRIGVPLSICAVEPDTEVAIIEAGIDRPGSMAELESIIKPSLGILTPITGEHDEGFESRQQKVEEKRLLFGNCRQVIEYNDRDNRSAAARAITALGYDVQPSQFEKLEEVSNRIDVHEGVNDCVTLYDNFTADVESLKPALDFMCRRGTPQRHNTVIITDLLCAKDEDSATLYRRAAAAMRAAGIERLVGIGSEIATQAQAFTGMRFEAIDNEAEFFENYDINSFSSETILVFGQPQGLLGRIKTLLESPRHDTTMEVNLDSIVHNFNYYRSLVAPGTGMVAMVKASAYGMGAVEIAKTLQAQGAAYLAVAVIDEGVELRRGGITMPIMILNPITGNYRALFDYNLEASVFSGEELTILNDAAHRYGIDKFKVHIKLDTGMHRVGFTTAEIPGLIEQLHAMPSVVVASIFSHLATADCLDMDEYTQYQLSNFEAMSSQIVNALSYKVLRHILNTAGISRFPEYHYDMVRLGIGLYGISPIPGNYPLRTVATLKSTIISLHRWEADTTIGYSRRGVLERESLIATVPIGYADGVNRHLGRGASSFVVNGHLCPTVGNICMDLCMIDVTDVPDVTIGSEVEIFGKQMPVEKLAETLDTIPYEVLTSVAPRVKRIYFRE
ncbi:MAG: alanine racemase [Muribaculaceae bacterium]